MKVQIVLDVEFYEGNRVAMERLDTLKYRLDCAYEQWMAELGEVIDPDGENGWREVW